MDQPYDKISDTLAYFEVDNNLPYYVSSGKKQIDYPQKPFRMDYYSDYFNQNGLFPSCHYSSH